MELVVFAEASAETHLLQHPAGLILEWLEDGPKTMGALIDGIAALMPDESNEDIQAYVQNAVQGFGQLGLLELVETGA